VNDRIEREGNDERERGKSADGIERVKKGERRQKKGKERTLFESLSLTTLTFWNDLYFSNASVKTFSVQSFETSETKSRNHLGSHSVNVGLHHDRQYRTTNEELACTPEVKQVKEAELTRPTSSPHPS
jgi:hypothetical protein